MDERKYTNEELRTESMKFALSNCAGDEAYDTTGDLIRSAQEVFEYLKSGSVPKEEVGKDERG